MVKKSRKLLALIVWMMTLLLVSPVVVADSCSTLIPSVPRGITCLHCLEPRAKASATALIQAVKESCLSNVALAFALDGAFGTDERFIRTSIRTLKSNGQAIILHLYFLNGPTNRRAGTRLYSGFANSIAPPDLRRKLRFDPAFQNEVKKFVGKSSALIRWAVNQGVNVNIVPMLEDNLDNASFRSLLRLTKEALPKGLHLRWLRNPCPDCSAGNQSEIPRGLSEEDHRGEPPIRAGAEVVSNDGWGFVFFPGDPLPPKTYIPFWGKAQRAMTLNDLAPLRDQSESQGAIFLLWLSKYQVTLMGAPQLPVHQRQFPVPTESERKAVSAFLRGE